MLRNSLLSHFWLRGGLWRFGVPCIGTTERHSLRFHCPTWQNWRLTAKCLRCSHKTIIRSKLAICYIVMLLPYCNNVPLSISFLTHLRSSKTAKNWWRYSIFNVLTQNKYNITHNKFKWTPIQTKLWGVIHITYIHLSHLQKCPYVPKSQTYKVFCLFCKVTIKLLQFGPIWFFQEGI